MTPCIALALVLTGAAVSSVALAQTCNPRIRLSQPSDRYVVNAAQGTVLDIQTGLIWKRCAEGLSGGDCDRGIARTLNWSHALRQSVGSSYAGYKDWRVPNLKELKSLVEVACVGPAINAAMFPNTPADWTWSSSPNAYHVGGSWSVSFHSGYSESHNRGNGFVVRLVRGGQ
ncbi:DUF1566 domain-containing protein [Candidatus Kaiserbacteria bacterium]|nr:DUF1566 domain-containing protein [Candidatus Kaiserbacteria bacterium]